MRNTAPDAHDRSDRFTWGEGDVMLVAMPNARGQIIEVGQRVWFGQAQGIVERLEGVSSVGVVTDDGQSHTVGLNEVEPSA